MKRLIFVNGTMGVGKSAVCSELKRMLAPCAFLDGDWCWDLTPFSVTEETKAMVLGNAAHLLRAFLTCSAVENVLFCWVMPDRAIIEELCSRVHTDVPFSLFTLTARAETLCARLRADIGAGKRAEDVVARSLAYLPRYEGEAGGTRIATDNLSAADVARQIAGILLGKERI